MKTKVGILITVGEEHNFINFDIDQKCVRELQDIASNMVEETIQDFLLNGK